MPAMKRPSSKAQKIADRILGTPSNMQKSGYRRKKVREELLEKDTRLER